MSDGGVRCSSKKSSPSDSRNNNNAGRSIYRRFFGSSSDASLQGSENPDDHHHARLGEYAARLWKDKDLTDVMIVVQSHEFKSHKAVLACYSPYFKEVLLKPGANNIHYMEIPSVTPKAFEILLTYMYTGEIELSCQDLADVYRAARRLGMKDALSKCLELLSVSSNHIEHTIHLYVTSKKLNLLEPAAKAFKLMTAHFETLIESLEFLDLNEEQLLEFFSADEIGARSELMIYLAALSWLSHNFLQRESSINEIIGTIRFALMTLEEVVYCFHPPVLPGIIHYPVVREAILAGLTYIAAKSFGQEELFKDFSCPSRTYLLEGEPIILWNCQALYNPNLYENYRDSIAATKIQAIFRGYAARKQAENELAGLNRAATIIQAAFRSHLERSKFQKLIGDYQRKREDRLAYDGHTGLHALVSEAILRQREGSNIETVPVVEFKPTIYIVGGIDAEKEDSATNCILSYDPITKAEWKEVARIPEPRHDIKIVFFNNELYCIGGCVPRDSDENILVPKADCFRYSLITGSWRPMPAMDTPRAFHGVAALKGLIYAIGGKNDHDRILATVECYNPLTNVWMDIKDMSIPRIGMGVAGYLGKIWVAGGLTNHDEKMILVDDVEVFEPSAFKWVRKGKLPYAIAFTSLATTNDGLYCIGGAIQKSPDAQEMLSKDEVYEYDVRDNYWKKYTSLPMPLHTPIALGLCRQIYVLGGFCSQQGSILKEIFYFDCRTRKWCPSCYVPMDNVSYIVSAWGSENN